MSLSKPWKTSKVTFKKPLLWNNWHILPLSEGDAVDLHDAVLHQCLGSDELIVTGIVDHVQDTALTSDGYKKKTNYAYMTSACITTVYTGLYLGIMPERQPSLLIRQLPVNVVHRYRAEWIQRTTVIIDTQLTFWTPGEVAFHKSHCTIFNIATTSPHFVDSLWSKLHKEHKLQLKPTPRAREKRGSLSYHHSLFH